MRCTLSMQQKVWASAHVSRAGDSVLPSRTFRWSGQYDMARLISKIVLARQQNQHSRRVRYPELKRVFRQAYIARSSFEASEFL